MSLYIPYSSTYISYVRYKFTYWTYLHPTLTCLSQFVLIELTLEAWTTIPLSIVIFLNDFLFAHCVTTPSILHGEPKTNLIVQNRPHSQHTNRVAHFDDTNWYYWTCLMFIENSFWKNVESDLLGVNETWMLTRVFVDQNPMLKSSVCVCASLIQIDWSLARSAMDGTHMWNTKTLLTNLSLSWRIQQIGSISPSHFTATLFMYCFL